LTSKQFDDQIIVMHAATSLPRPVAAFFHQFGRPEGALGALAGRVMARRNGEVNAWAVELLDVQAGEHVLEIGCGPGLALAAAARGPAARITGVDPSPVMVAQARRRSRRLAHVTVLEAGAEALPVADASVDRALAVNSLSHWSERGRGLAELARVLRPGGQAALVLRLRNPAAGRLDRSAYGFSAERAGELAAALSAAGLEPTARRTADCDGEATLALLVSRGSRG
jgi:ubiquinone/menaquinone biosynthesis C-methylase UbiE